MKPRIRCAIYTRKSSDDGLDQSFNSLDAQREACEAFIASQRHEGWVTIREHYDDGGLSGATLERPALERLLGEVDAGRVDRIVVYKIDRLTRSLADFAKLVERFDAANCSFVSVTQAFNTATSMGRLTLNVLLSFAQFEREVTAERIRDKIAASKKKGLWMGGLPPLGYDLDPDPNIRGIVTNEDEAERVRRIFQLYAEHRCLRRVFVAAREEGITSKQRVFTSGRASGGNRLTRGQIHFLLTNPIYIGKIRHKDALYPGQHRAIVDQELWDDVQATLQGQSSRRRFGAGDTGNAAGEPSGLIGKLFDENGDRLTPTHTSRRGKRYRYYVSSRLVRGEETADPTGWRLPAAALEARLVEIISNHLAHQIRQHRLLETADAARTDGLLGAVSRMTANAKGDAVSFLETIVDRILLNPNDIRISLSATDLARRLSIDPSELNEDCLSIAQPVTIKRRGIEAKFIVGDLEPQKDQTLIRALAKAHRWADAIRSGTKIAELASNASLTPAFIFKRLPLAFLAPSIQADIVAGRLPPTISLERLVRSDIPHDWEEQRRLLRTLAAAS